MTDIRLRRRVRDLLLEIRNLRRLEIGRALEFKNAGNDKMAAYHTGLADGRNAVVAELLNLAKEYPADREATAVEAVAE